MQEQGARLRADEVLRRFFDAQLAGASTLRAERLRRAEADLLACLEELAPVLLTDQERALLALEQQFEPEGALARVAGADAVLLALPVFLDEPLAWERPRGPAPPDRARAVPSGRHLPSIGVTGRRSRPRHLGGRGAGAARDLDAAPGTRGDPRLVSRGPATSPSHARRACARVGAPWVARAS